MSESLWASIGLSLCAIFFTIIIIFMYIRKRKNWNFTNAVFFSLLILTIVLLSLEVFCSYLIDNIDEMEQATKIFGRIYVFLTYFWEALFTSYIILVINNYRADKIYQKIKGLKLILILLGEIIAALIPSLFLSVEFSNGANGLPYVIGGTSMFILHIISYIGSFAIIFMLSYNKNRIENVNVTPIYVAFIIYVIATLFEIFLNYEINDSIFFFAVLIGIAYATFENQDNKLLSEFKKSKQEAEIANKAKTEFLINMSHEIRTPLNTILGFSESLLNESQLTEEIVKNDLKNISDASSTLIDLINNILDISRIESGSETLNESNYNLENLIFEINSLIPSKINKEELKFTIEINEEIPKEYHGDAYKIFKIICYVLMNAIEYTNYGEVKLSVDGKALDNNIFEFCYLVSNTGHAMLAENFEKNFEDFVKIENASQNNVDTIKLGLIIAKQLTKILGGNIEFVNAKGQGTKYYIRIRQKIVNAEKIGNIFESRDVGVSSSSELMDLTGKKCLIVDDSEVNLKLASRYMQQYKFTIYTATSGKECVELSKNNEFDVIFLDHMMPDMDGIATIKALNSTGYKVPPIVALTANSYNGLKNEYISQGFTDYLQKPINFRELNKVINRLFNSTEGGDVK